MTLHAPPAVVMVRPHRFRPNPATAADNRFQVPPGVATSAAAAHAELTALAGALRAAGVVVHLFEDTGDATPDSVFPNNWFSTHADGTLVLYPMHAANRQRERRQDVVDLLVRKYHVTRVVDLAADAAPGVALEGTGAMVLDHLTRTAYVCLSRRADPGLLRRFAQVTGYQPVAFAASDRGGAVYHTNVLMAVGTTHALVGADLIDDDAQRAAVVRRLGDSGREVIRLDRAQVREFAGNCLELTTPRGPVLAMSSRARAALGDDVVARLAEHVAVLDVPIPTLETAGGSVRCTLGGVHLRWRAAVVTSARTTAAGSSRS